MIVRRGRPVSTSGGPGVWKLIVLASAVRKGASIGHARRHPA